VLFHAVCSKASLNISNLPSSHCFVVPLTTILQSPSGICKPKWHLNTLENRPLCGCILDFADKKVHKCVIEGKVHETTFEQMREYYARIYPQLVTQLEREAPIDKGIAKLEAKISPGKK
jgi:hypothetical protein